MVGARKVVSGHIQWTLILLLQSTRLANALCPCSDPGAGKPEMLDILMSVCFLQTFAITLVEQCTSPQQRPPQGTGQGACLNGSPGQRCGRSALTTTRSQAQRSRLSQYHGSKSSAGAVLLIPFRFSPLHSTPLYSRTTDTAHHNRASPPTWQIDSFTGRHACCWNFRAGHGVQAMSKAEHCAHCLQVAMLWLIKHKVHQEEVWTNWLRRLSGSVHQDIQCNEVISQCYQDHVLTTPAKSVYDEQGWFTFYVHSKPDAPDFPEGSIFAGRTIHDRIEVGLLAKISPPVHRCGHLASCQCALMYAHAACLQNECAAVQACAGCPPVAMQDLCMCVFVEIRLLYADCVSCATL